MLLYRIVFRLLLAEIHHYPIPLKSLLNQAQELFLAAQKAGTPSLFQPSSPGIWTSTPT